MDEAMEDREAAIASLSRAIKERDEVVDRLSLVVAERDQTLAGLVASAEAQEQATAALNDVIRQRDGQLAFLASAVSIRDDEIAALRANVQALDALSKDLSAIISSRDETIQSLTGAILERDELIVRLRDSSESPGGARLGNGDEYGGWPVNASTTYEDFYVLDVDGHDGLPGDPGEGTFENLAVHLERAFREDASVIMQRHGRYFEQLVLAQDGSTYPIVDIGCGRGDFLRVAKELGHHCMGVEENHSYVDALIADGMNAVCADGLDFLEKAESDTFRGIAALQVVEHWSIDYLKRFLLATRRVLIDGGFLLIETVNPYCLDTFRTFYLDPTHQRPLPVDLLVFFERLIGFDVRQKIFQVPRNVPAPLAYPPDPQLHYESYAVIAYARK